MARGGGSGLEGSAAEGVQSYVLDRGYFPESFENSRVLITSQVLADDLPGREELMAEHLARYPQVWPQTSIALASIELTKPGKRTAGRHRSEGLRYTTKCHESGVYSRGPHRTRGYYARRCEAAVPAPINRLD